LFHPLFQPIVRLITSRPELLVDHAQAYAELFSSELGIAGENWKRQLILNGVAVFSLAVGVIFAGVALLLCAMLPVAESPAPWALIAVPVAPFVLAIACLFFASRRANAVPFSNIRRQLAADLAMVREAGSA
jgi:uncharacterized membrane protein YqjE